VESLIAHLHVKKNERERWTERGGERERERKIVNKTT